MLNHTDLTADALRFVERTLALPTDGATRKFDRLTLLRAMWSETRKQHLEIVAQHVAIAELARRDAASDGRRQEMDAVGIATPDPTRQAALVELVSLYAAANRFADARSLLDEATDWGARDISEMRETKDSQGVPFSVIAARVLAATGDQATAMKLAIASIDASPGFDGAYDIESTLDPNAASVFETQLKRDRFEERPLIWGAILLFRKGEMGPAEAMVRRAIAVDPSDGEEGVNDRMRAYAVLADILEAKGDTTGAADFRQVVAAIRISERSDELHSLGLYPRAFAGYREALGHFSDAYCIQSRLAVQLSQQGLHEEAAQHNVARTS